MEMKERGLYWRYYYKFQWLLARDINYMEMVGKANEMDHGVRPESSLPYKLNELAGNLAFMQMNSQLGEYEKEYINRDREMINWFEILHNHPAIHQVTAESLSILRCKEVSFFRYKTQIDLLRPELRAMLDTHIVADHYFVAEDGQGETHGGFGTNENGNLTGLFATTEGKGEEIFILQLQEMKKIKTVDKFQMDAYTGPMTDLAKRHNFTEVWSADFDKNIASDKWNGMMFGYPKVLKMERHINGMHIPNGLTKLEIPPVRITVT